jgi:hypothetical protein
MRRTAVLVVLCVFAVVGLGACGGATTSPAGAKLQTTSPHVVVKAKRCPHGKGFMGCSLGASPYSFKSLPGKALVPNPKSVGRVFPDVSSYQGCAINWSQIPVPGAIVKGWEYSQDPCLAHNAASLNAAHKKWAIYQFVRFCNASALISLYRRYHPSLPPVLDEEVSSAAGCTAPMAQQVHAALGVWPIEYTSPGTEQSGASADHLVLWEADYGPRYVCLWTCPKAWQFASPPYIYYRIPGLGYGDVNRDMGLLELGPKPIPKCLAARFPHTTQCYRVRYGYHHLRVDLAKVDSRLREHQCYRRRHPSYCGGWKHARRVDRAKLAALHKKYA